MSEGCGKDTNYWRLDKKRKWYCGERNIVTQSPVLCNKCKEDASSQKEVQGVEK